MIRVTRLNGQELVINADLIEFVEANPDTIISLTTGKKIIVKESTGDIIERVAAFKRQSAVDPARATAHSSADRSVHGG